MWQLLKSEREGWLLASSLPLPQVQIYEDQSQARRLVLRVTGVFLSVLFWFG